MKLLSALVFLASIAACVTPNDDIDDDATVLDPSQGRGGPVTSTTTQDVLTPDGDGLFIWWDQTPHSFYTALPHGGADVPYACGTPSVDNCTIGAASQPGCIATCMIPRRTGQEGPGSTENSAGCDNAETYGWASGTTVCTFVAKSN